MNKDSVTSRLRNKSSELNIEYNLALDKFFFDEFLKLLSFSKYKENFTLKGGMLLTYTLGIENRSTRDIDFLVKRTNIDYENIEKIFDDILSNNDKKGVWFEVKNKHKDIKIEDKYGGVKFYLVGHLSNIRKTFSIDIATGDPVYPVPELSKYTTILGDNIEIQLYPLETVIAEKLQTIIDKAEITSRMKDFYDIHIIIKNKSSEIDIDKLRKACLLTFKYRNTNISKDEAINVIKLIGDNDRILRSWDNYRNKNKYVENVEFDYIVKVISNLIDEVF